MTPDGVGALSTIDWTNQMTANSMIDSGTKLRQSDIDSISASDRSLAS
jgi:hypothetical protein